MEGRWRANGVIVEDYKTYTRPNVLNNTYTSINTLNTSCYTYTCINITIQ